MTLSLPRPADLLDQVGTRLGPTDWVTVEQGRIGQFAGRDRRSPVDPRRRRAGERREPLRRPDRPRLPHARSRQPVPAAAADRRGVLGGPEHRARQGAVPLARCPPARRSAATGEIVSAVEAGGGVQVVVRITIEVDGCGQARLRRRHRVAASFPDRAVDRVAPRCYPRVTFGTANDNATHGSQVHA